jgi:hypothetical protein
VHPEAKTMSRKNGPEPFYRPKKNRWYVEIDGKHINLGPDEEQARVRWHQLMAGRGVGATRGRRRTTP